jgi:GT2 family glycosyltransferase
MKLAAVILNWKSAESTMRCVTILQNNFIEELSVYIVDNHSDDGSVSKFRAKFPKCHILENTANSGYTGGNNFGLKAAFLDGHEAVLILNNDIEPRLTDEFTSLLASCLAAEPNTLIGLPVQNMFGNSAFPQAPGKFIKALFKASGIDTMTPLICGCAMVVPRTTFEKIGGLNEQFFMYCEELDYTVRVAKAGGRVICPAALGYVVRDDDEERRPYVYYYQARNLIYLILLHAKTGKLILSISSVLISLKQTFFTGKPINILFSLKGVISALRGRTGRSPNAHT